MAEKPQRIPPKVGAETKRERTARLAAIDWLERNLMMATLTFGAEHVQKRLGELHSCDD
jgi:hypothetical protein